MYIRRICKMLYNLLSLYKTTKRVNNIYVGHLVLDICLMLHIYVVLRWCGDVKLNVQFCPKLKCTRKYMDFLFIFGNL